MRKYIPYDFDMKYQYRTYKNIGETHRIDFKAKKNFLYKIWRVARNLINKNEKKYMKFDTFSQWENYICEEFGKNKFSNQIDCICYLKRSKRSKETACNMLGAIVTPIYVVLLTMGITLVFNSDMAGIDANNLNAIRAYIFYGYFCMAFILFFILLFLMSNFIKYRRRINFFDDLIMILENEK